MRQGKYGTGFLLFKTQLTLCLAKPCLHNPLSLMRKAFEEYLDNKTESGKTLMNATKRAEYLRYLADPEQKIHETDKVERKRLNAIKPRVIKEYCMDSRGQLLHIAQKKGDITKPQAFIYDAFDYIERIHAAGGHNGYKKNLSTG